jgi:hypothetical protein
MTPVPLLVPSRKYTDAPVGGGVRPGIEFGHLRAVGSIRIQMSRRTGTGRRRLASLLSQRW